jgi:hypothetical protein
VALVRIKIDYQDWLSRLAINAPLPCPCCRHAGCAAEALRGVVRGAGARGGSPRLAIESPWPPFARHFQRLCTSTATQSPAVVAAVAGGRRAAAVQRVEAALARAGGAAAVASFSAAVLTEIYLCNVCSCPRNIETPRPRPGERGGGAARPAAAAVPAHAGAGPAGRGGCRGGVQWVAVPLQPHAARIMSDPRVIIDP